MLTVTHAEPPRDPSLDHYLGMGKPFAYKNLFLIAGKSLIIFVIIAPLFKAIQTKNLPIILITALLVAHVIAVYLAIKWSIQTIQNRQNLGTTWAIIEDVSGKIKQQLDAAIGPMFSAGPFHRSYK